jgi:lipoprotein LprG
MLRLLASAARARRPLTAAVTTAALLLALTGCGGDDAKATDSPSPGEVMATAKKTLDDTSGVRISLATQDLPAGTSGLTRATGVGIHPPAFDGTITVSLSGNSFEVPVVAVDDKVFVQLPLTKGFQDIDPGEYGAPDPAQLMSADAGFSSLLTGTTGLRKGTSVRGGSDNSEILTEYTGTVPASAVKNVIPTARGSFDATYTVADSGELRQARLTGAFYPKVATMTYTLGFDGYGTRKKIVAP